jgi:tRNA A-37 threonylcarbamoyl transferase component Bud32
MSFYELSGTLNQNEPIMNTDAIRAGNSSADSLIGTTIDEKYRIESKLGEGGMGTVYLSTRLMIGDAVAIKVLHMDHVSDAQAVERFRREAQAAARLKHPNAVNIHDFGVSNNGLVYLVMELVEGESLRSILKQQGPLTPSAAAEILTQVCAALDEAHRQHIVHRDLKPDNIIVTTTAGGWRVKVLDFGIAKMRDLATAADNLTQTGTVMGTPHYMSPEQCLGEELDGRSDIYNAGIMLFEMLSGMVPFSSPASTAVIVQHVTQPPPPLRAINASISPAVEAVVRHALEKPREARPQTAVMFAQEMIAAVSGTAIAQPVTTGFVNTNPSRPLTALGTPATGMAPTMQMRTPTFSGAATRAGVQPAASGAQPAKSQSKRVLMIVGAVILIAVSAAVAVWVTKTGDKKVDAPIRTLGQGEKHSPEPGDDKVITNPPSPRDIGDTKSDLAIQAENRVVKGEELSDSDILGLSLPEIRRLRNTIFARHGRSFQRPELQNYFVSRPWYRLRNNYSDGDLTPADHANTRMLIAVETRMTSSDSASKGTESSVTITATASSTRTLFRGINYSPENVLDGSTMTAWVEGVKGPGIGEWIQLNFDHEVRLRRIFIAPGYFKSQQIWLKNNRLAVVSFHFSDGSSREFQLTDQMEEQRIEVVEVRTVWVRIEIKQVYVAQSDSEDTAISEIRFEWEPQ